MTIIDSHDISAADEPELLKTLASLARRPWHSRAAKAREWQTGPLRLPCPPRQRLEILKSMSVAGHSRQFGESDFRFTAENRHSS